VPSATFPKANPNPVPLIKQPRTHLLSANKRLALYNSINFLLVKVALSRGPHFQLKNNTKMWYLSAALGDFQMASLA